MSEKRIYMFSFLVLTAIVLALSKFYPGSTSVYLLFTISTFLMIYLSLKGHYVGPVFLSFFLFMGIWLKINIHLLTKNKFTEPIGHFDYQSSSWDSVLMTAGVGILGLTLSFVTYQLVKKRIGPVRNNISPMEPPRLFALNRVSFYILTMICVLAVALLNMIFRVHQIGLNPQTIFPWPLNSLIAFLINFGFIFIASIYLYWDIQLKKNTIVSISFVIFISALLSISALSRGMYVIQLIPFLFVLAFYTQVNFKRLIAIGFIFCLFLFFTVLGTSILRNKVYPNYSKTTSERQQLLLRLEIDEDAIIRVKKLIATGHVDQKKYLADIETDKALILKQLSNTEAVSTSATKPHLNMMDSASGSDLSTDLATAFKNIIHLSINRFVGAEGLMAMQSYPDKSMSKLLSALIEKRQLSTTTMYQTVALSNYRYSDNTIWQFATLPGPIAFFNYSGSLLVVFIGMYFLGGILILAELGLNHLLTFNHFSISMIICGAANTISQFGVTPRHELFYYFTIIAFLLFCLLTIKLLRLKNSERIYDQ